MDEIQNTPGEKGGSTSRKLLQLHEAKDPDYALPKKMDGHEFVEEGMIKAGLLHHDHVAIVSVPILSLLTYLQKSTEYLSAQETAKAYREQNANQ